MSYPQLVTCVEIVARGVGDGEHAESLRMALDDLEQRLGRGEITLRQWAALVRRLVAARAA